MLFSSAPSSPPTPHHFFSFFVQLPPTGASPHACPHAHASERASQSCASSAGKPSSDIFPPSDSQSVNLSERAQLKSNDDAELPVVWLDSRFSPEGGENELRLSFFFCLLVFFSSEDRSCGADVRLSSTLSLQRVLAAASQPANGCRVFFYPSTARDFMAQSQSQIVSDCVDPDVGNDRPAAPRWLRAF